MVAAGNDTESAIALRSVIKVEASSDHALEKTCRWLNVRDFVFDRPRAVVMDNDFF